MKSTTYNVDLTVEEQSEGAPVGPSSKGASPNSKYSTPTRSSPASAKQSTPAKSSVGTPGRLSDSTGGPQSHHGDMQEAQTEPAHAGIDKTPNKHKSKVDSIKKKSKGKDKGKAGKHAHKSSKASSSGSSSSSSSSSETLSDSSEDEQEMAALGPWRYPFYSPSASYRQVDVVSGSHQYTVSGFSLARAMGCGTRLCSDFFEVAGQLFRLELYPSGFTADARKYVSAFLTTPGAVNPNHILYEIAILDQSGKDKHIIEGRTKARQPHGMGPMLSHCRGIVGAVPKFVQAKYLLKHPNRYLVHDMLVVRATVHVLKGWSSAPTVHPHMASLGACQPCAPAGLSHSTLGRPPGCGCSLPAQHYCLPAGALPLQPAAMLMSGTAAPGLAHLQPSSPVQHQQHHQHQQQQHMGVRHASSMHTPSQPLLYAQQAPGSPHSPTAGHTSASYLPASYLPPSSPGGYNQAAAVAAGMTSPMDMPLPGLHISHQTFTAPLQPSGQYSSHPGTGAAAQQYMAYSPRQAVYQY